VEPRKVQTESRRRNFDVAEVPRPGALQPFDHCRRKHDGQAGTELDDDALLPDVVTDTDRMGLLRASAAAPCLRNGIFSARRHVSPPNRDKAASDVRLRSSAQPRQRTAKVRIPRAIPAVPSGISDRTLPRL